MKKWYLSLLAAFIPMLAISFASCSSDDDILPDVNITLDVSKGVISDGTIYIVKGDTIVIDGVKVVNNEANKAAAVTDVTYYWNGVIYSPSIFAPYGMKFPIPEDAEAGMNSINMTCTVLAVDKSIAVGALSYPVRIVDSEADLPSQDEGGQIQKAVSLKN